MTAQTPRNFLPLDQEPRERVDTNTAAFHVNRSPKTLRAHWAAGNGPITPIRVGRRLAWKTSDIRQLLQVEQAEGVV